MVSVLPYPGHRTCRLQLLASGLSSALYYEIRSQKQPCQTWKGVLMALLHADEDDEDDDDFLDDYLADRAGNNLK